MEVGVEEVGETTMQSNIHQTCVKEAIIKRRHWSGKWSALNVAWLGLSLGLFQAGVIQRSTQLLYHKPLT